MSIRSNSAPTASSESARPVLAGDGISVQFGGIRALSDVSIEIAPQSITGLIGPNGAGKSTLIGVLSGLIPPTSGRVYLGDVDVTSQSAQMRARRGMARTFQQPELFAGLSVREHLVLAWRIARKRSRLWTDLVLGRAWKPADAAERDGVDRLLERLGLQKLGNAPVAGLPLGYSRLVEVGRALAASPRVVLLDEPLSGLNGDESQHLAGTLLELTSSEEVSFLLVDHDVDIVLERSNTVTVLDFGQVIATGSPEQVRADERVRSAYLGDPVDSAAKAAGGAGTGETEDEHV
jgi:ABC-type branched-subunit amino acid transport system ATPase component